MRARARKSRSVNYAAKGHYLFLMQYDRECQGYADAYEQRYEGARCGPHVFKTYSGEDRAPGETQRCSQRQRDTQHHIVLLP